MTGMEVITAKKLGLRPTFIVMNNAGFITLKFMAPNLKSNDIPRRDYAGFANLSGGRGYQIHTRKEFRNALQNTKRQNEFTILDVRLAADDVSPIAGRLRQLLGKPLQGQGHASIDIEIDLDVIAEKSDNVRVQAGGGRGLFSTSKPCAPSWL